MELTSDEAVNALGLLIAEAAKILVDSHDESLDKRAAMMRVDSPTFTAVGQNNQELVFQFKVKGNRQKPVLCTLIFIPNHDQSDGFDYSPLSVNLDPVPECECDEFKRLQQCSHTLAASWWLQEQLARRSISEVFGFFEELEVDSVAAGRDLCDELLRLADEANDYKSPTGNTRLQWRVGLSDSRYYAPLTIVAYEQRPRKNGKGWTKGKEIRSYDLLKRDFLSNHKDGEIAALIASPSYSFEGDHFTEFRALQMLAGHNNVAWDDSDATPLSVLAGELTLGLEPVEVDVETEDGEETVTRFRPKIGVSGIEFDLHQCDVIFGNSSPVQPIVVIADTKRNRLIVCTVCEPRATRLIQFLLSSDLKEVLLDAETASKFAVGASRVDSLMRVGLPQQLAGPIEGVKGELIFELKPRVGAGLHIAMVIRDERFREFLTPGGAPEIVACLTDEGPVRLQRDLTAEKNEADGVVQRFQLSKLSSDGQFRWVAETDEAALNLLAKLHEGGESTPRMIWPEGESIRVRGEITPAALRVHIDDRKDWFGLSGTVSLDGSDVKLSDLLKAVRERRSLVQVGDREFAKISDAFRKRLEQLGDAVVSERGSLKVADAAVPAVRELIGEDVSLEASARWHQSIERLDSLSGWTPDQPDDLDVEFRDYQLEGYRWLAKLSAWGVGGILADDMGLGKTVQALGVLVDRSSDGPGLVIAPTSVGDNWIRETQRFAPNLNPKLYRESNRDELIKNAGPGDLIVVSYQLVQRDAKKFASRNWQTLVLDEAQFIKNSQTKTSQAIRKLEADWRIGLSGTPLENHLGELWSLMRTISPGLLGSWERFRTRFADPIERHKDDERRESLARLVRPFILRRTKDKVLQELPPRTEIQLTAELSGTERQLYEDARLAAVAELSGITENEKPGEQRMRTLAWLTRLRQLACHPRLVDKTWTKGSAKLDLLMNLVQELREGDHRALLFSQFVKHLSVIREELDKREIDYQYLDGSTPAKERQKRVDAFQNGEGELFLISLKAGGTGLNLTAADYVIHLDPWWNPAVEDQATDRAHRIGQQRPVTVYRLVAQGTIEEQILEMHADKRELVAGVLDGTDRAAKMNTDDLIKLIREGTLAN